MRADTKYLLRYKMQHDLTRNEMADCLGIPRPVISAILNRKRVEDIEQYRDILQRVKNEMIFVSAKLPEDGEDVYTSEDVTEVPQQELLTANNTLHQAWRAYQEKLDDSNERQKFMEYFKVHRGTLSRWRAESRSIQGENSVRLISYLDKREYTIFPFANSSPLIQHLAHALSDRTISYDTVCSELPIQRNHLYERLRGDVAISSETERRMQECIDKHIPMNANRGTLDDADPQANGQRRHLRLVQTAMANPSSLYSTEEGSEEQLKGCVGALIDALQPLVVYVLSDAFTPAQRSELRKMIGAEKLFDVANLLNGLCGEQARSMVLLQR